MQPLKVCQQARADVGVEGGAGLPMKAMSHSCADLRVLQCALGATGLVFVFLRGQTPEETPLAAVRRARVLLF